MQSENDPSLAHGIPEDRELKDTEIESIFLGTLLQGVSPAILGDALQVARPQDFCSYAHHLIFLAVARLFEQGANVDHANVADFLGKQVNHLREKQPDIKDVQYSYFLKLMERRAAPSSAEYYARLVKERAILRGLERLGAEFQEMAKSPTGPAEQMLAEAESKVFAMSSMGAVGTTWTWQETLNETCDLLDSKDVVRGIPSGLIDLDNMLGGFHDSELIIVAARPSVGKTAFGLQIAKHASMDEQLPVLFASLEQKKSELAGRLLCAQGRVNSHHYRQRTMTSEDYSKLSLAKDALWEGRLFIDDGIPQSMLRIAANARRLKSRHGIKMIVVDYLQLVEPESRRESRQEHIANVSRRLKCLARELKVPVVAMAQLNRGAEDHQRPKLSDLRESGAIEQDADVVIMLYRPDENKPEEVGCIVGKQRNGPTGEVTLFWIGQYMKFENFCV